jgi:predicted enzyme related to lactoylglutathione lyase
MDCTIGYVIVGVTDLERAIAFYRDAMGFEFVHAAPEFHFAEFRVGDRRFSLAGGGGGEGGHKVGGNTGIGFVVADVDAAYRELSDKGVEFTLKPERQPWGGYMGMFADPDGNVFYLDQVRA